MPRLFIFLISVLSIELLFAQKFDAELLNQETRISIKNNRLTETQTYEIRINNRSGEIYATISLPFSGMDKISGIEGYIKDNQGNTVRKLKKNDITEKSAFSDFSFYEDRFVKEFTLKHDSYPYTLVYSYQLQRDEFIYVAYWMPVISNKVPTLKASMWVELPNDYPVTIDEHLTREAKTTSKESNITYSWSTSYKEPIKAELFSPAMINYLPRVIIVPQDFKYETDGSFNTWASYGDWQNKLLSTIGELPEREKGRVFSLVTNMNDPVEKIRTLYHYLQDETRYINISTETGGLKPHSAFYVAENKYGDCKALTNYFKSILDLVEIPSYYTNVRAGDPIRKLNRELPSQQYNHVILYVPLSEDTLWLDCTSKTPFNYLGTFTQNREVFIVEKTESYLSRTPALSAKDVLETRKVNYVFKSPGEPIAQFDIRYRGDQYENLFYASRSLRETSLERYIRNHQIEDGYELIEFQITEAPRDSAVIQISYIAIPDNVYKEYGTENLIKLLPFSIPEFEKPGT
jgi:hypothetical protein